jgi:hypothetical protein
MQHSPPYYLTVGHLITKFPTVYGSRTFITVFTKAYHWTLTESD